MRRRPLGDDAVGGRAQDNPVAAAQVPLNQRVRGGAQARRDLFVQEPDQPRRPAVHAATGQRTDVELAVGHRTDGAGTVVVLHRRIQRRETLPRQHAFAHQEVAPQRVAVTLQQRVVEIEDGQLQVAGCPLGMPISRSVSATAATACRISLAPMAPMQPTRKVSTWVSLPG